MTTEPERLPLPKHTPLQLAYAEYQLEVAEARVVEARKRVAEARAVVVAEQDKHHKEAMN